MRSDVADLRRFRLPRSPLGKVCGAMRSTAIDTHVGSHFRSIGEFVDGNPEWQYQATVAEILFDRV